MTDDCFGLVPIRQYHVHQSGAPSVIQTWSGVGFGRAASGSSRAARIGVPGLVVTGRARSSTARRSASSLERSSETIVMSPATATIDVQSCASASESGGPTRARRAR